MKASHRLSRVCMQVCRSGCACRHKHRVSTSGHFVEGHQPRTHPSSSPASWRRRWGFLRWGWCRGSLERCCPACGPLKGPTGTEPPSGQQGSCRADRWWRLLSCSREAGAAECLVVNVTRVDNFVTQWEKKTDKRRKHSLLRACQNTWAHRAKRCLRGWPASQTPKTQNQGNRKGDYFLYAYRHKQKKTTWQGCRRWFSYLTEPLLAPCRHTHVHLTFFGAVAGSRGVVEVLLQVLHPRQQLRDSTHTRKRDFSNLDHFHPRQSSY